MKKPLLILLFTAFNLSLFAQDSTELAARNYYNTAGQASHHKMAWFTGHTIAESIQFQEYLQTNLHYISEYDNSTLKNNIYTTSFHKSHSGDPAQAHTSITLQYSLASDGQKVNQLTITGNWSDIIQLFTYYWEKPINRSHKIGEIFYINSLGDRVAFINISPKKAQIKITNNGTLKD